MRSLFFGVLVALVLGSVGLGAASAGEATTTIDTPTTVDTTPTTVDTTPTTVDTTPEPTPVPTNPTTPPNTPPVTPRPTLPRTPNTTAFRPPTASTTPDETTTTVADDGSTTSSTETTVATSTTGTRVLAPVVPPTTASAPPRLPTFEPDTSPAASSRAVSIAIIAVLGVMATAVAMASRRRSDDEPSAGPALAGAGAGGSDGAGPVGDTRPIAARRDDVRDAAVSGSFTSWMTATKALEVDEATGAPAPAPAFVPPMLAGPAWVIPAEQAARTAAREARENAGTDVMADAPELPQRSGLPPMVQARAREDAPQVAALVELARRNQERSGQSDPDPS